jgi:hypothetical protein
VYDVEIFEANGEKLISTSYPNLLILLSHPDKGFIRVVADERFGYDARAAYVEARMREWRNAMHARTQRPDALGYVDARPDDATLQPQTEDAALDHFHRQYSEVSDRQITREIHAEIVGSSRHDAR